MNHGRKTISVLIAAGALLLIVAFFAVGIRHGAWPLGFPLDDAWIHVRFAQNLLTTGTFAFNPGQPTAGTTSPLWVVLLAAASLPTGQFLPTAVSLGILTYLLLTLVTLRVAQQAFTDRAAAVLTTLIVVINVRVLWAALSGMEICLAAALALAAAGSFACEITGTEMSPANCSRQDSGPPLSLWLRPWLTPMLFGLATLARPEAHLLFGLAVLLRIARSCRSDTPVSAVIRIIPCRMIGVYLLITLPWHLFSLWTSGSFLPNTFHANFRGLGTQSYPTGYYWRYAHWLFVRDHPWVYWFAPLGLLATMRWSWKRSEADRARSPLLPYGLALAQLASLWVCLYPLVSRMVLPIMRHHARYMIPLTPFHAILAVVGLSALVKGVGEALSRRWRGTAATSPDGQTRSGLAASIIRRQTALWAIAAAAVVLSVAPGLWRWTKEYAHNVHSINHQHVAMALWLRDNTPADAVIAAHDIGALGAIAQHPILDLLGLANPAMIRRTLALIPTAHPPEDLSLWYLEKLEEGGACVLVGYPQWLGFTGFAPDLFDPIHRETLKEIDICGGLEMVAYRIDREALAQLPAGP